jgi:hypothetical protein
LTAAFFGSCRAWAGAPNAAVNAGSNSSQSGRLSDFELAPGPSPPIDSSSINRPQKVWISPALEQLLNMNIDDEDAALAPADPVEISSLDLADLDTRCPPTTLVGRSARAGFARLSIPRFAALLDDIRDTGLSITQDGKELRILTTWTIACANQTARVLLLSPTRSETLRTYEADVSALCVRLKDSADRASSWFCGQGTLGAGVPAYGTPWGKAELQRDRVSMARSIRIGQNTWSLHFALSPGLAPISARTKRSDGFASPDAWNLNPNDSWPDGVSKAADYLAAIAIKTTTATTGASISVYNRNALGPGATSSAPDPAWLNDCEKDGARTYYANPELGSRGTFDGVFLDVAASDEVFARCESWMKPLGIRVVHAAERRALDLNRCRYLPVGPDTSLRIGVNTDDASPDRQKCLTRP